MGVGVAIVVDAASADRSAAVGGFCPLPVKLACCGLSALLSVITSVAAYRLAAVGLKLTVIEQKAPAASALAQVLVWEKTEREAGPPVIPMLLIVRLLFPVLVTIICIELTTLMSTRPNASLAGASFTVPFVRVIAAPADLLLSDTALAKIATAGFVGIVDGAVYVVASPLAVLVGATVPHASEQGALFWLGAHVTPLFAPSFLTVAVNCCALFRPISTEAGDTDTEIGGGTTVTVADADLVVSDTEVAVSVTVGFVGTDDGAK